MTATVQPGYTRCFYTASYASEGSINSDNVAGNAKQQSIVLCIDRDGVNQQPDANQPSPPDSVANGLQAAIALAEQDPLLQYVASWLNQDFEWLPMQMGASVPLDLTLSSAENADYKIGLSFDHCAQPLPEPPVELDGLVVVQEHKQSLAVCLAQLHLSADDQQRLQPGSCIVLPDTFKDTCIVSLIDAQSDMILTQVCLERSQNRLSYIDDYSTQQPMSAVKEDDTQSLLAKDTLTRVVLEEPVSIDLSQWARRTQGAVSNEFDSTASTPQPIGLDSLVGLRALVKCDGSAGVEEYAASLIEVGAGLAVVLDSV